MSLAIKVSRYGMNGGGGEVQRYGPITPTMVPSGIQRFGGPMMTRRMGPGGGSYGDPGFFDFLGGIAKKVTGVVSRLGIPFVSGAAGVARGLLGGQGPGMGPIGTGRGEFPVLLQQGGTPAGQPIQTGLGRRQAFFPGGATGMGEGCGQGHRPNKSGYWLNSGQYVEPGTVCVKRRRMNPLNPRALSKAMRRIESAKRATAVLGRITIRKKC